MKTISLIIILFSLLAIACEKTSDLKIYANHVIVVNSFISPSSPVQVNLSKSIDINSKDTILSFTGATVLLYLNDTFADTLYLTGDGSYQSAIVPQPGGNYKIEVAVNGMAKVTAQTQVPEKPVLSGLTFDSLKNVLQFSISDNGNENNFYYLSIKGFVKIYVLDSSNYVIYPPDTIYIYKYLRDSLQPLLFSINDQALAGTNYLSASETWQAITGTSDVGPKNIAWAAFSDNIVNGQKFDVNLELMDPNITISPAEPLYVELKAINQDYYKYLKSKYYTQNTGNSNPFSETVAVYSNINGGTGIWGAFNLSCDSVINNVKK